MKQFIITVLLSLALLVTLKGCNVHAKRDAAKAEKTEVSEAFNEAEESHFLFLDSRGYAHRVEAGNYGFLKIGDEAVLVISTNIGSDYSSRILRLAQDSDAHEYPYFYSEEDDDGSTKFIEFDLATRVR